MPPGMSAVIKRKLLPKDFRDMTLYAKRFSAEDGVKGGFVDGILKEKSIESLFAIAKERSKYGSNK